MATFPTAEELQRPIPRVDGSVPTYQPATTSDAGPRAMAQAGQVIQSLGQDIGNFAERLDMTDAQDALNKFRQKRQELTLDPEKGFLRLKGKAAIDKIGGKSVMDITASALDAETEALSKSLSPRAAAAFRARAINETQGFKMDLVKHQISEGEKYETSVFNDTKAQLTDRAILSADDPKLFEERLSDLERSVDARAATLGVSAGAFKKGVVSDAVSFAIKQKITKNDSSVIGFFDRYKDRLDAKDRAVLEPSITALRANEEGKALAAGVTGPANETARAGVKTSMEHWTAAGYSAPVAAGMTAGFLRESQFDGNAIKRKDGRDGSDSISIGQWNGPRGVAYKAFAASKGLDPRDPKTGLLYARAEIDGVIPYSVSGLSPDFKAKLQAAKSEKEAADIMTRGYFRPEHTEGESAIRQGSASTILAQYKPATTGRDEFGATMATDGSKVGDPAGPLTPNKMMTDARDWHLKAPAEIAASTASDEVKKAAQHRIDVQFGQRKEAAQLAKDKLNDTLQEWVTKPDPKTGKPQTERPMSVWAQLTPEQQRSIDSSLKHNAEGTKAITKPDIYYAWIRGLSDPDLAERQKWIDKDLLVDKPDLADEQFRALADKQATARKGDPDAKLAHGETITKKGDRRLRELEILPKTGKPTPAQLERAGDFHLELEREVRKKQRAQNNKPLEPEQVDEIIMDLTYEVTGTGGWFDFGKKRAFEVMNANVKDYVVTMKNIPPADIAEITKVFKARNIPVTDENIIKRYRQIKWGIE